MSKCLIRQNSSTDNFEYHSLVRDRLETLRSHQQQGIFEEFEEGLLSLVFYCPLQEFLDKVQDIRLMIIACQADIRDVSEIQDRILSSPVTNGPDHLELDRMVDHIQRRIRLIGRSINLLSEEIQKEFPKREATLHFRIKKTQQLVLSQIYGETVEMFSKVQSHFRYEMKDRIKRFVEIKGIPYSEAKVESMIEAGNYMMLPDSVLSPRDLTELENRHSMILNMEQSLKILQGLFFDIQHLIAAQGQTVDRIENIVLMSEMFINDGVTAAQQAQIARFELRKKRRRNIPIMNKGMFKKV